MMTGYCRLRKRVRKSRRPEGLTQNYPPALQGKGTMREMSIRNENQKWKSAECTSGPAQSRTCSMNGESFRRTTLASVCGQIGRSTRLTAPCTVDGNSLISVAPGSRFGCGVAQVGSRNQCTPIRCSRRANSADFGVTSDSLPDY